MDKPASVLHYQPDAYHPKGMAAGSAVKGGSLNLPNLSFDDIASIYALEDRHPELKNLKTMEEKRTFVAARRDQLNREIADLDGDLKRQEKRPYLKRDLAILRGLGDWVDSDLRIERPDGISFRHLRKAVAEDRCMYLGKGPDDGVPAREFEKEVFRFAEVLLIEHDWSAALQQDMSNATVKLPYDVCAFEFKFSGRAVIALATQLETDIVFSPAIQWEDQWMLAGWASSASHSWMDCKGWNNLFNIIGKQIRAACIALDAEVARSDIVREPYTAARGRNSYHEPKPYHVVSLAHRAARPLASTGVETDRRVRLHFRRGHWRHFEDHRTWIKWMLVGNPDLGFVDKHYKL